MRARNIVRDRQPEAAAAFVLMARLVKPQEWLEHLLAHRPGNAWSVIVYRYGKPAMVPMAEDRDGR